MIRMLRLAVALVVLAAGSARADIGAGVASAAIDQTRRPGVYDPSYVRLAYPMGDPPAGRGVCSDVVVRALRAVGVDLQQLIHEDMTAHFGAYPALWGLSRPDPNIDHRRVPNIEAYLARSGARLPPSLDARDYRPGDIVAWNLRGEAGFLPHVGVVTDIVAPSGRPMIAHDIGTGPRLEDVLFAWPMTGRYRLTEAIVSRAGTARDQAPGGRPPGRRAE